MANPTFSSSVDAGVVASGYSACFIDATRFAVTYNSGITAYLIIGSISGTTITWGTPSSFAGTLSGSASVSMLDSTHLVIAYGLNGGSNRGNAIIAVISGTTISSFGTAVSWTPAGANGISQVSCVALDATHFVVMGNDSNNSQGVFKLGTVASGTVITYGTQSTSWSGQVWQGQPDLIRIDATTFIAMYYTSSDKCVVQLGTYSGTSLTMNTPTQTEGTSGNWNSLAFLDSTHFIVGYASNSGNANSCRIATISGTSISLGTKYNFYTSANSAVIKVVVFDSTHLIVFYSTSNTIGTGVGITGTISAGVITYDTGVGFPSPNAIQSEVYLSGAFISSTKAVAVWGGLNGSFDLIGAVASVSFIVGPTNLKTYNTNPSANIKTIDTNPIANVKSLNTNT